MNVRGHTTLARQQAQAPVYTQATPQAPASGMSLHIDRLVLNGLPLAHDAGSRVQAALSRELTRLLGGAALRGDLRSGAALSFVRLDNITLDAGCPPDRLGRQLAEALVRNLAPSDQTADTRNEVHHE